MKFIKVFILVLFLSTTAALSQASAEIKQTDQNLIRGLRCSVEMQAGTYRVGDPVVIQVNVKNVTDKPVNFYYCDLSVSENLIVENQKGKHLNLDLTALKYNWPHPKVFIRLIKPGQAFSHQIRGRVKYKLLTADQLRKNTFRPLLIDFGYVECHIADTGNFTLSLQLIADDNKATMAKSFGINNLWIGTLQSNKATFNVKKMSRKELDKAIETLSKGSDIEKVEAIEVLAANADQKAVKHLMEILKAGRNLHMRKVGKALIRIQDTSIVPELTEMYEKPAPNYKTEREFKYVVMNAIQNLESKQKANERFVEVLKSDAPFNEIYYAGEQLALAAYEPAVGVLIEVSRNTNSRKRGAAMAALEIFGHRLQGENRKLVYERLLEMMKNDPDKGIRKAAVKASATVGGDSSSPHLIEALKDPDELVVFSAAIYLGRYGSAEALTPLQEYVSKLKIEKSKKVVLESMKFIRQRTGGSMFNVIEMKWGEAVNGLQLGLLGESKYESLLDRKSMRVSYCCPGDLVSFRVFARNNGDKVVKLVYDGMLSQEPTVLNLKSIQIMQHKKLQEVSNRKRVSLLPGEMKQLGPVYLQLASRQKHAEMRSMPILGFYVSQPQHRYLTSGKYYMQQKLVFHENDKANFHGELTTGKVPLRVSSKPIRRRRDFERYQKERWGLEIEGMQVHLKGEGLKGKKLKVNAGDKITMDIDVRNRGKEAWSVPRSLSGTYLKVDNYWFVHIIEPVEVAYEKISAGGNASSPFLKLKLVTGENQLWQSCNKSDDFKNPLITSGSGWSLQLKPGRHQVQLFLPADPAEKASTAIEKIGIPSVPVEIEILPKPKPKPSATKNSRSEAPLAVQVEGGQLQLDFEKKSISYRAKHVVYAQIENTLKTEIFLILFKGLS